jgi:hypothetical protein
MAERAAKARECARLIVRNTGESLGYAPERSSTSRTVVAVQAPPRIVLMPRLVNSASIRRTAHAGLAQQLGNDRR